MTFDFFCFLFCFHEARNIRLFVLACFSVLAGYIPHVLTQNDHIKGLGASGVPPEEKFLLNSYQLHYPDHIINWTRMVETMGRCDTTKESIENLLQVKQMHFPDQPLDLIICLTKE